MNNYLRSTSGLITDESFRDGIEAAAGAYEPSTLDRISHQVFVQRDLGAEIGQVG